MNKAYFKSLREFMGFTLQELANSLNLKIETVKRWETGQIKTLNKDAVSFLLNINKKYDDILKKELTKLLLDKKNNRLPDVLILLRYKDTMDLWREEPHFAPATAGSHATYLIRMHLALKENGINSNIFYFGE